MIKQLYLLILLLSLSLMFACAPKHEEQKPIPLYKDTLIEDEGPC